MHGGEALSKDLLLIGGGHAHIAVIRRFGMRPWPGVRLTVISADSLTPYSGMLPGLVAGHYSRDDSHIDLQRMCQWAGARLFHARASGLDLVNKQVLCEERPPVRYDLLSINTGSQPATAAIEGADSCGAAIKPIDTFMVRWQQLQLQLQQHHGEFTISVVGGGAAGVEVCLGMQQRLRALQVPAAVQFQLVTDEAELLPSHNPRVRGHFNRLCRERGIALHCGSAVVGTESGTEGGTLQLANGESIASDFTVWALPAGAQPWPAAAGLACDGGGFIQVNASLQSLSHPEVFAAGDCAATVDWPLAKSGVYAVRQGPVLADNLQRALSDRPLKRYRPQRRFLSLISTGDKQAVASRGALAAAGRWAWRWKDAIDRRFIARFNELPAMATNSHNHGDTPGDSDHAAAMRCGGCGAKVGSQVLERVLAQLPIAPCADAVVGHSGAEDAAILRPPPGKLWLQSVDYFRLFIDDPWLLGRIGANHCLGDIYAMGATPHSALALCTIPHAAEAIVEDSLRQLLAGALSVLDEAGAALVGGHSNEGAELAFGLTVNGVAEESQLLTKSGLRAGDALLLTKPLGSGTLLVASAQGRARADWIDNALAQMQVSQRRAADILHSAGAGGCTDITGFGLLGHLLEMLRPAGLGAELDLAKLPLLEGVQHCLEQGLLSSLHPDNWRNRRAIVNLEAVQALPLLRILFDPQTAGGLLAGVEAAKAEAALAELRAAGYEAAIIGRVSGELEAGRVWVVA